jgi:GTPase SAR1 family protein
MRDHHLRHGDGFILVYSTTNRMSFIGIPYVPKQDSDLGWSDVLTALGGIFRELYEQVLRVKDTYVFPAVLAGTSDDSGTWKKKTEKLLTKFLRYFAGNKCDMVQSREIEEGEGLQMALHLGKGIPFLETSAKLRTNVNEIFHILTREIDHWRNINGGTGSRQGTTGPIPSSPGRRGRGLRGMCVIL